MLLYWVDMISARPESLLLARAQVLPDPNKFLTPSTTNDDICNVVLCLVRCGGTILVFC